MRSKIGPMPHSSMMLLVVLCGVLACSAHSSTANEIQARKLLQAAGKVPVVAPDGSPTVAGQYADGQLQNVTQQLANLAKTYKLASTTYSTNTPVYKDVDALYMLSGASAAKVSAAVSKAASSLIAAVQANQLPNAAIALTELFGHQETYSSQSASRAILKLLDAQPAKAGGILGLMSLLAVQSQNIGAFVTAGYELRHTWAYAVASGKQSTVTALAQASANAASAAGVLAARTYGQALGNNLKNLTAAQVDTYGTAVAAVLCKGSPSTDAWGSLYSVAMANEAADIKVGCAVLSKAWGLVNAQKCSTGDSKALTTVLKFCKVA